MVVSIRNVLYSHTYLNALPPVNDLFVDIVGWGGLTGGSISQGGMGLWGLGLDHSLALILVHNFGFIVFMWNVAVPCGYAYCTVMDSSHRTINHN